MCCVSCTSLVQIVSVKRTERKYREKIVSIHVHAVNKAHFYINTMLRKNIKDKDVIAQKCSENLKTAWNVKYCIALSHID